MYRQKPSPQYENFRKSWMTGYRNSLKIRQELQSQGWMVERGALTPKQVERTVMELEREGYETRTIPVVEWEGETVQFVAYKPKPEWKPPEPTPTPKPEMPSRDPVEVFREIFWKGRSQPEQPDGGVLLDPEMKAAVVPKNASPQEESNQKLLKLIEEITQKPESVQPLDYNKFVKVEKIGKMQNQPQEYVSFGSGTEVTFSIDLIKKALKVLGAKKNANAYYQKDQPLIINMSGHSVVIAPSYVESSNPKVVQIGTVQAV